MSSAPAGRLHLRLISSKGPYVQKFEEDFSRCGGRHGVAVSNGTVALHLACRPWDRAGRRSDRAGPDICSDHQRGALLRRHAGDRRCRPTWCMALVGQARLDGSDQGDHSCPSLRPAGRDRADHRLRQEPRHRGGRGLRQRTAPVTPAAWSGSATSPASPSMPTRSSPPAKAACASPTRRTSPSRCACCAITACRRTVPTGMRVGYNYRMTNAGGDRPITARQRGAQRNARISPYHRPRGYSGRALSTGHADSTSPWCGWPACKCRPTDACRSCARPTRPRSRRGPSFIHSRPCRRTADMPRLSQQHRTLRHRRKSADVRSRRRAVVDRVARVFHDVLA